MMSSGLRFRVQYSQVIGMVMGGVKLEFKKSESRFEFMDWEWLNMFFLMRSSPSYTTHQWFGGREGVFF